MDRPTSTINRALSVCARDRPAIRRALGRMRPRTRADARADAGRDVGADLAQAEAPRSAARAGSAPWAQASDTPTTPSAHTTAVVAVTTPGPGSVTDTARRCAGPVHRWRPARWRPFL